MSKLSTWVEVDLDAFASNLRVIRRNVGEGVRVHLVVKADAYGHGVAAIARVAADEGVHSLGVATLDEGIELRRSGAEIPVIVLSPSLSFEADRIVGAHLTPTIGNVEIARSLSDAAVRMHRMCDVHVEIDTGMGRTGIAPKSAVSFLTAIRELPALRLAGLYTHFPKADDATSESLAKGQLEAFGEVVKIVKAAGIDPGLVHAANSAAIVNHVDSFLDMVRPGILAYGFSPGDGVDLPESIRPVMRFATRVVHVRELPAGHPISYGGDFVTPRPMRVGTEAVGYGHGYPWTLSGKGHALVRGRRVPILGRVTMDTTVFDLTEVPEARLGDEIVLLGRQGTEEIRVNALAQEAGTIGYELLCGIGRRVTRVYTRVGRRVGARTLLGPEPAVPPAGH